MKSKFKVLRIIESPTERAQLEPERGSLAHSDEARIVAYLRGGIPYIVSPGVTHDVLDGSGPVGTGSVLVDGEWAWTDDLAHYVEKYHWRVPPEFLEWMQKRDYRIVALPVSELRRLCLPSAGES